MFLLIDNSKDDRLSLVIKAGDINLAGDAPTDDLVGLLENIDKFFKKNRLKINELEGIAVVVGQGRFTLTRIAVTVANTLAYALHIPVAGVMSASEDWVQKLSVQPVGQYISAKYSAEPNIGKPKKK